MHAAIREQIASADQAIEIARSLCRKSCGNQGIVAALSVLMHELEQVKKNASTIANPEALVRSTAHLEQSNAKILQCQLRLAVGEIPMCHDAVEAVRHAHYTVLTLLQHLHVLQGCHQ